MKEFKENARPILTIHVGQAGVQIGNALWELLCLEHNVRPDGLAKPNCQSVGFDDTIFVKSASGHFMPRSILVDTDPICIDEIRVGPFHGLFSSKQLLSDNNDASFNYMKGRQEYKHRLLPTTIERFRWLLEKSDMVPSVFLFHGISGGTGSGFTVSCLEEMRSEFGTSIQMIDMMVSSGHSGQQNSCELINQVLYHYETKDLTDVAFTITNSAMYNLCRLGLSLTSATYAHLNRMLAMCFSNLTSVERFHGTLPSNISNIFKSVLPFRSLKHLLLGCAPFSTSDMVTKENLNIIGITSSVMDTDSQFADVDLRQGRHMAGVLLFRGAAKPSDVDQAVASLKLNRNKIEFVDWAPPTFKTGLTEFPSLAVPSSGIGGPPLSVTLVSNNTAVSSLFRGHSENIRKLKSGSFLLHHYEIASSGGIKAGHNRKSVIGDILNEATNHMDELVAFYDSSVPLDHLLKASKGKDSRPLGEVQSRQFRQSEGKKDHPSLRVEITTKQSTQLGRNSKTDDPSATVGITTRQPTLLDAESLRKTGDPSLVVENTTRGPTGSRDSESLRKTDDPSPAVENATRQSAQLDEGSLQNTNDHPSTANSLDGDPDNVVYVTKEHSVVLPTVDTKNVTNVTQSSAPDGPDQEASRKSADGHILLGTTPQSQDVQTTETTTTETIPAATTFVVKPAQPLMSKSAKKTSSGGCCSNKPQPKKTPIKGANTMPADQSSPIDFTLRQRAQPVKAKRTNTGCCGGGSGGGAGGATKRPPVRTKPSVRLQSQNHANTPNLSYTLDTESIMSTDGCPDIHVDFHPSDLDDYVSKAQNNITSTVSTDTPTDSAADIDDILKDCLQERMSINCTISTARQIIKKYNDVFSQSTIGS